MRIAIAQLGLAAYVAMNGAELIEVENKIFYFESDRSAHDWRVSYNNSCCMKHDTLVCELRFHLK
jgi:hypothetical protein